MSGGVRLSTENCVVVRVPYVDTGSGEGRGSGPGYDGKITAPPDMKAGAGIGEIDRFVWRIDEMYPGAGGEKEIILVVGQCAVRDGHKGRKRDGDP